MKLIYVAGPYRSPDGENGVFENIMAARTVATKMAKVAKLANWGGETFFPVVPHLNTMFMGGVREDQYWLDGDMELLRRCDGVLLMNGWEKSSGAIAEKAEAERLGLPVFYENEFLHD
jgi:hypothetical protein